MGKNSGSFLSNLDTILTLDSLICFNDNRHLLII